MSVNESRLNELEYVIIPGRLYHQPELEGLHNQSFVYWKLFWRNVFTQNGCPEDLDEDSFVRQNMICMLKTKKEIVGMHLYSFYDLELAACLDHSYIKSSFTPDYIKKLQADGIKYVMSLEFLTVNPNWRKRQLGLSLGEILIGLSGQVLKSVNFDASIAPSRSDVGVTEMACNIGGEIVIPNIEIHKTVCDLIAINSKKIKNHPNDSINQWVHSLWGQRQDYTKYTLGYQKPTLRVA